MKPLFRTLGRPAESRDNGFTRWLDIGMNRVASGVSVTQDTAMNLPVVYRCVALNSETIGALPVDCLKKVGPSRVEIPPPPWVTKPNPEQTWQEFVTQTQMSLEQDGNAYLMKAATPNGQLVALYVLAPSVVNPKRVKVDGRNTIVYEVRQDGEQHATLAATELLHIRGLTKPGELRGLSPIMLLKESIGVGLAAQEFAGRWFGEGANMTGIIEMPGQLTPEQEDALRASLKRKHGGLSRSHAIGILKGGATFKPISVNAEESQFLQTTRVNAAIIALAFGVPAHYATDAEGAKGYVTGVIAGKMMWLQFGLLTRITRLENAFSSLMPTGYLKFNLRAFLRGSPEEETQYLSAQKDRAVINTDEWRALLDLNPLPDGTGQEYINTLANSSPKIDALASLIRSGFDPHAALKFMGFPDMEYLGVQPVTLRPVDPDGLQLAPAATDTNT